MSTEDPDLERLRDAANALGEHFDTVQILVTRHEEGETGTVNASWGTGNWFARFGQVREWVIKSEERSRELIRRDDSPS